MGKKNTERDSKFVAFFLGSPATQVPFVTETKLEMNLTDRVQKTAEKKKTEELVNSQLFGVVLSSPKGTSLYSVYGHPFKSF